MKTQSRAPYVPDLTVEDYISFVKGSFPELADLLWFDRAGASAALEELSGVVNEFETNADDGRGASYRLAQRNRSLRRRSPIP